MSASNPIPPARAWADIDLGALVANARTVLSVSGSRLLPMVKANAYGVGAAAATRALEVVDPWGYGVVTPEEGAALRREGIRRPIVVFGTLSADGIEQCLRDELRPVIGDLGQLRHWLAMGDRPFHVEIDTGMRRLGFSWTDRPLLGEAGRLLDGASGWEGVFTHFHSADTDPDSAAVQWDRLQAVIAAFPRRPPLVHAANSAAAMQGPRFAGDLVRPGIFLYGGAAGSSSPEVVVRFRAPVVASRRVAAGDTVSYGATWRATADSTIVTVGAGYADGVPRSLSGVGNVELGGRLCPIVGRVTMDFTMIDVGAAEVPVGSIATIFGGAPSLDTQASAAGTISYELLTRLGPRIVRRYSGGV
ncbi:MAG TPA: alanine racemase [Gemmatimonadales bacterium]|nr:alanine racemase [Gemmatimonadales bacterium]